MRLEPFLTSPDVPAEHIAAALAARAPHLTFRGGKILSSPSFASIYYGPYWKTSAGRADSSYEDTFGKFLLKSDYMSVLNQYGVKKGKFLGSSQLTPKVATKTVNDNLIQRIVAHQIFTGAAPKPDGQTVYTVFLQPGTILKTPEGYTSLEGLGGYHGSFDLDGKRVYYAAIVYSEGSNGIDFDGVARDNISITASHEWAEAATDPDVTNGKLGWYDDTYGEIADIPISQGLDLSSVYDRLGGYAVQKLWSNIDKKNEITAGSHRK